MLEILGNYYDSSIEEVKVTLRNPRKCTHYILYLALCCFVVGLRHGYDGGDFLFLIAAKA